MTDERTELTIEHLTAALRHAEDYLRAVRAALQSLEGQGLTIPPVLDPDSPLSSPGVLSPNGGCRRILTGDECLMPEEPTT